MIGAILASLTAALWATARGQMKRRAGDQPVPGADQALAVTKPPVRDSPPAPGHGGIRRIITLYGDGRTEITRCPGGGTEIIPGRCGECTDGTCSWCATYPAWDGTRYVHRYQRCPAHDDHERQP
jgi:hypothetical protein